MNRPSAYFHPGVDYLQPLVFQPHEFHRSHQFLNCCTPPVNNVIMHLLLATFGVVCAAAAAPEKRRSVLVTGAAGRTGKLLYAQLKARKDIAEVKAFVFASADAKDNARKALNCTKCDASEGIFYGDVTDPSTLEAPMAGVDTVAICVSVGGHTTNATLMKAVEIIGVENQVQLKRDS